MSIDDPFGPTDRTIIKPAPGGSSRATPDFPQSPQPPKARPSSTNDMASLSAEGIQYTGANPILKAATALLATGGQLRRSSGYDDTNELFRQLSHGLRQFEADVRAAGEPVEHANSAQYIVCGFLDEAILNTPWGHDSDWAGNTLSAHFYSEANAGEKVFEWLVNMIADPTQYLHLLELVYVCLSLGFRGKFRTLQGGEEQVESQRVELFNLINRVRNPPERELSSNWRGAQDLRPKLTRVIPTWVYLAVAMGATVLAFSFLLLRLETRSDPVAGQVAALGADLDPAVTRESQAAPRDVSLVDLLQASFGGEVLEPGINSDALVLRQLFSSGSSAVEDEHLPLLGQVAEALNRLPGPIVVSGHSDNVPIRTLRYPSNWQLSEARALSVVSILVQNGVSDDRIVSQSYADTKPVCETCDQNSREERERNRRVGIQLGQEVGRR